MKKKIKNKICKRLLNIKKTRIILFSVFALLIIFFLVFGLYSVIYANKIYSNQYIGGIDLGGQSKEEAQGILSNEAKVFLEESIVLNYQIESGKDEKQFSLKPEELGLKYDVEKTVDGIWDYGRNDKAYLSFFEQLKALFAKTNHNFQTDLNTEALNKKISEIAADLDQPEKDFAISYQNGQFILQTERQEGWRINQAELKKSIFQKIAEAKKDKIFFEREVFKPQISEEKAKKRLEEANLILSSGELVLIFENQKFNMDADTIGGIVAFLPDNDDLKLSFTAEREKLFVANIAAGIDIKPVDAKLGISGGKTTIIAVATFGKTLDQTQTIVDIENALNARVAKESSVANPKTINLKVEIKKPAITNDSIGNLGINELVGTGTTNFIKSPSNRVHNINIGATAINGALIAPGETFSTLNKLGAIDADSGYLPELVIKNNSTVPDYGGGLCQVSTTLFRAALNAGLKITERQNHSYRVSYYEPPIGMDATIYSPSPDFKFVNNYSTYILIQSRIEGTKISFDIYGTKDSRKVTISTPNAYNYVDPPPREDIPTDTLPAGTIQQVQKAHQGASASFNYKVEKDGLVLQDKTFVSVYIALPEKWLVGQGAPPVPPEPAPAPTPTPEPTPPAPIPEPTT